MTPDLAKRAREMAKDIIKRSEFVDSDESRGIHYYKAEALIAQALILTRQEAIEDCAKVAESFPNHPIHSCRPRPKTGWRYMTKEKQKRIATAIRRLKEGGKG